MENEGGEVEDPIKEKIPEYIENEESGRNMLWSGVKDVGYGTVQVTFGVLLLSTALVQSAAPTGVSQVTGVATGAAGAWYLVGGVGSLGLGAGKISQGLQNRDKNRQSSKSSADS